MGMVWVAPVGWVDYHGELAHYYDGEGLPVCGRGRPLARTVLAHLGQVTGRSGPIGPGSIPVRRRCSRCERTVSGRAYRRITEAAR